MNKPDDFEGFQCICGEWVAVMHTECAALLGKDDDRSTWR